MLAESIIRVGKAIVSSKLPKHQRIRWLTDCDSVNCKNYFQNVFLVELDGESIYYHFMEIGTRKEKDFEVDFTRNNAYPIIYPQGGNPLWPQGIYPMPCYLIYDRHIKSMNDPNKFAKDVVLPRLEKTVSYAEYSEGDLLGIALKVANSIAAHYDEFISKEKQLGILYIYDHSLVEYQTMSERRDDQRFIWITKSGLKEGEHLYLDGDLCLENIIESKFEEAKTLGYREDAVSTFSNKVEDEVASIYNKFWLWLSPTWDMPKSIYWPAKDWTDGIKVDKLSYEAYLYGTQFLNNITVPISSSITKEMFSPIMNVEAKKHMKPTSFERVFGVPIILPLIDKDPLEASDIYLKMAGDRSKSDDKKKENDIHLELLAGIDRRIPQVGNEYRITLLYYSGDLSRGNMHVRMVLEDIVPTVAKTLQRIVEDINRKELPYMFQFLGIKRGVTFYRTRSLPSMLSNAYGPGYVWSSLQTVFNRKPISIARLYRSTVSKLNELANKEDHLGMIDELIFHYSFITFFNEYNIQVLKIEKEVKDMADWAKLLEKYYDGEVTINDLTTAEELGFVTGLLLKEFSNSYYHRTGKDFIRHRVMKFGSKLTPEMIWKDGVLRCEELAAQWDMGLSKNFHKILSYVLLAILDADSQKLLQSESDQFMTAFWSGHLMYRRQKEEE